MTGPIIDSHCHTGTAGVLVRRGERDSSLTRYLSRAERAGIGRTVLMAPPVGRYADANREVQALVAAYPGRFLGYVFVNPRADRGRVARIVAGAVAWGARGIKVHWSDGVITSEIAEAARRHGVPVLYDPRGDIPVVRRMTCSYPDVAWIVPHLSSFADDWKAQAAFVDELSRTPNLFTDTSGVRYFDILADAVRRAGAHKILFGTDGPYLHPGVELAKIRALGLSGTDFELVAGGNLIRLAGPAANR
ncbi:amidohydrolase family protein [Nocardia sp. CA-290969]|uniref:amidohydrolase family protein n=1 Tax=Nocardia sp. CA-290969 TaxID=3239986 RepID=UPI003D938794